MRYAHLKRNTEVTIYEHTPKQEFSSPGFVQASNADDEMEEESVPTTPTPIAVNSRHPRHQHQDYPHLLHHRDHHAPHDHEDVLPSPQQQNTRTPTAVITITDDKEDNEDDGGTVLEFDSDSDSSSDYLSFEDSENEGGVDGDDRSGGGHGNKAYHHKADKEARERERQRVLEAAGLIVQRDVGPPPVRPPRSRQASASSSPASRMGKRRPAPAAPQRMPSGVYKELPPVPPALDAESGLVSDERRGVETGVDDEVTEEAEVEVEEEAEEVLTHEARLDDAFARYESFKNAQANQLAEANNRLSVVSTDSSITMPASPTTTISSMSTSQTQQPPLMVHMHMHKDKDKDKDHSTAAASSPSSTSSNSEGRYAHFLNFLTNSGSRATANSNTTSGEGGERRRSVGLLNISGPIMTKSNNSSFQTTPQDGPSRANSPAFGMSWASLVDKNALDGIPPGERKRQEVGVDFLSFFLFLSIDFLWEHHSDLDENRRYLS